MDQLRVTARLIITHLETTITSSHNVLVVEDEPTLRFLISDVLESEGTFNVFQAGSGDEALEYLQKFDSVDCIFTDVRMPGRCDGIELTKIVLERYPHIKVVMASGNIRPDERLQGVPFFPKPYDLTSVAQFIRRLLA